ncbi:hypothetical protein ZWY2020_053646 [Hordeum vulgare]|nr:hypothetical protein ZWY2020_053646 [Hordeum vulgare]
MQSPAASTARRRSAGAVLSLAVLLAAVGVAASAAQDAEAMRAVAKALGADKLAGWGAGEPCSPRWPGVTCDSGGRVTAIQLRDKRLTGTLAPEVRNLTALTRLELFANSLSGPLPSLAGLDSLQYLNIHDNGFTSIPADFFKGLTALKEVYLDNNPFAPWPFPADLGDCVSLTNFSANSVNITGALPDFFGSMPSLQQLNLAFNSLSGPVPPSLAGALSLDVLWLNGQKGTSRLNGSISFVANMTMLTQLWLHSNDFTGPLPDFSGLSSLSDLNLRDNQFTGPVPASLVNLKSLKNVSLGNNLLQGPSPNFTSAVTVNKSGKNQFCLPDGSPCDPRVDLLLEVAAGFMYPAKLAAAWGGNDPCRYQLGVGCDNGNITLLNFPKLGLTGTVSPSIGKIATLVTLILSNNNITGTVPKELAELPDLKMVDLSNNNLYGEIPEFRKNVLLKLDGNPNIGKDAPAPVPGGSSNGTTPGDGSGGSNKGSSSTGVIVGSVIGAVAVLGLIAALGFYCYKRKQKPSGRVQSPHAMVIHPRHSGSDPDMENILGRGGFGTVYKGELHDGTKIAVKRMESGVMGNKGLNEFKSEISVLTKAKVADFGLVRLAPADGKCVSVETRLAGTFGYLAPEYAVTGRVTTKADVFSFGVILMELVTGRRALDDTQPEDSMHLVTWFRRMQLNNDTFQKAIDATIDLDEETLASVSTVAQLAGHCCAREPHQRPDMGHAVNVLSTLSEVWKPADPDSDDSYGIDLDMTLPQALKKWQAFEDSSHFDGATSSFLASLDNTQTSIRRGLQGLPIPLPLPMEDDRYVRSSGQMIILFIHSFSLFNPLPPCL